MGGLRSGEWMLTTFRAVAADAAVPVYLSILEALRMGGRRQEEKEGWAEWMLTTFLAVAADAAVLVYLSILEAPGMGGRGEGEREGWAGWNLGSGC